MNGVATSHLPAAVAERRARQLHRREAPPLTPMSALVGRRASERGVRRQVGDGVWPADGACAVEDDAGCRKPSKAADAPAVMRAERHQAPSACGATGGECAPDKPTHAARQRGPEDPTTSSMLSGASSRLGGRDGRGRGGS